MCTCLKDGEKETKQKQCRNTGTQLWPGQRPFKTSKICAAQSVIGANRAERNSEVKRNWARLRDRNRTGEKRREERKQSGRWLLAGDVKGLAGCVKQNALALASLDAGLLKRSLSIQPPEWTHLHMQMKPGHIQSSRSLDQFVQTHTQKLIVVVHLLCTKYSVLSIKTSNTMKT